MSKAIPNLTEKEKSEIIKMMWNNYGKILAEYVFIKNFRKSKNLLKNFYQKSNELENIKKVPHQ